MPITEMLFIVVVIALIASEGFSPSHSSDDDDAPLFGEDNDDGYMLDPYDMRSPLYDDHLFDNDFLDDWHSSFDD